jgi:uncharacterized protein with FMN-binding domain
VSAAGEPDATQWRTRVRKVQAVALSAVAIAMAYEAGHLLVTGPDDPTRAVAPASLLPPAQAGQYRDGTYTGRARNVYGAVEVAVTVAGGRISAVRIVSCTTYYPPSYLDGLPDKVIAAQSADLPVVSGATGSWQDFTAAVQQALVRAAGTPQ